MVRGADPTGASLDHGCAGGVEGGGGVGPEADELGADDELMLGGHAAMDYAAEHAQAARAGRPFRRALGKIDDELLALGEVAVVLQGDAAGADVLDAHDVGGAGFAVFAGGEEDGGAHADARLAA